MPTQLPEPLLTWLEKVRPEHRALLTALHNLLTSVEPGFAVTLKWGNPAYSVRGETFAYLADQTEYVHLGFYNGAQFNDPHGLVEGTGKRLRHVKVSSLDPTTEQRLRDTISASLVVSSEYSG